MAHLISFGNSIFEAKKTRLKKACIDTGWFSSVTMFGPDDLDNEFKIEFDDILKHRRGAGYWIWKAYLIKKTLENLVENDILIYIDAGCTINPEGKVRYDEYIAMLRNSNECIISFQMHLREKDWTVKEIFNHFELDPDGPIANSGQIIGGILIMKKTPELLKMIDLILETYRADHMLVTDFYSKSPQPAYFRENRHDQSIFSIIRKLHGSILLRNETFYDKSSRHSARYAGRPFWATRTR